jgi:hypothetical protein
VQVGVLPAGRATGFSGPTALTRLEFATTAMEPLSEVDRALQALGAKADAKALRDAAAAALDLDPKTSEADIAQTASDLVRLSNEFAGELRALRFDPALAVHGLELFSDRAAVRAWRAEALTRTTLLPAPAYPSAPGEDDLRLAVGHGAVAFNYNRGTAAPEILDYLAMSGPLASSASARGGPPAGPVVSDPTVSRLRAAYEYGIGRLFTVRLGREQISRYGVGSLPLDAASVTSVGMGYRLTPSTSLRLSYSLLDYENYASGASPVRERVAETAVSVEF